MDIDNVYILFGKASNWANLLEEELVKICTMNDFVIHQEKYRAKAKDPKSITKKIQKYTIGKLINELKKELGKDYEVKVDEIFKPALEKRNYLIHNFFLVHHEDLHNSKIFGPAVCELHEIKNILFSAVEFANKVSNTQFDLLTKSIPLME